MTNYIKLPAVLYTAVLTIAAFTAVVTGSCKKDKCETVFCQNGGTCSNGACLCATGYQGTTCQNRIETTLTYKNNTMTPVSLIANGNSTTLPAGGTVVLKGNPGDPVSGSANTKGVLGKTIIWTLSGSFGESDKIVDIDVSSQYFFLAITNNGAYTLSDVYVNYGLTSQTYDAVNIPNDGTTYGLGYYEAYTNSNARAESTLYYWDWNLNLPFTANQLANLAVN